MRIFSTCVSNHKQVHQAEGVGHMRREQHRYLSYLLRLWQIKSEGELVWRASLESPHTGERQGFAGLEALFAFLQRQADVVPDGNASETGEQ